MGPPSPDGIGARPMQVKKYVLLVDAPDGELALGAGELKASGYDVALVPDLGSALTAATELDRLSLVVVDCRRGAHECEEFMASIRGLHPNLPVIWLGDSRSVLSQFLKPPCASEPESNLEGLRRSATKVLRERFYANDLVREIVDVAEQVLREFGVEATRSEPYFKSNLSVLGDINAHLSFSGEGLSGHLLLTATAENARTLHRRSAPKVLDPREDDLEDLLGEISNRVLGGIKRIFESRALSFKLRTPSFIRGAQARYRSKSTAPRLAIEFADDRGFLRLEFCADHMNTEAMTATDDSLFLNPGQITFL